VWVGAGFAAWILTVGAGLTMLWAYAGTPGPPAAALPAWPAAAFARDAGKPALVLFLHPQCPCSRATVSELARRLAEVHASPAVYALIYRPSEARAGWEHTDLWDSAAAIPGVHVMTDDGGAMAHAFGAIVSGQALLYDAAGALQFSGGITGARGHEGDNPGHSAVREFLNGDHRPRRAHRSGACCTRVGFAPRRRARPGAAMTPCWLSPACAGAGPTRCSPSGSR
jgi:hypothetical protein